MSHSSERVPGLNSKVPGMLDISDEFTNMFQFPYSSFKEFEEDLAEFQLRTSTSYRITRCVTAGRWLRDKGEELPICFPYKYVSYYCVHKRKKQASAKCRFVDYDCKASFCIAVCDDQLVLSKSHMLHSHDFHIGNPWMYARNRRLSARDEQEVSSLLDHCHSGAIAMTPNNNVAIHHSMLPPNDEMNKYGHLLQVIEEMGRDIKPTYANNKNAAERLKKNIHTARILVRECVSELERVMKS
ncbi:Cyclin-dependent kinase 2-associated protein 2 [Fasciolopsis buskii]|uniref:Cyclin-dependent kinase 2-associated protein 2 n=1 Tax=Fasciolopsis buskii TaxID=27845 RepID=A0A8E0VJ34_9TREM|nr:Cyclin-dependent kinase 2-associated protein 2 [Fasciolopsis buski]